MFTIENAATAASVVIIFGELAKASWSLFKKQIAFSWHDVDGWVDKLYDRLQAADVAPDVIVGIGRGGAVVAGLISTKYRDDPHHHRQFVPIATIDRVYINNEPIIVGVHNLDVHGKRVLLLNADSYSGLTLYRAREILGFAEPTELWTGSLVTFDGGDDAYEPDFVGAKLAWRKRERHLPWRQGNPRGTTSSVANPTTLVVLNGLVATGKTSVADSLVKQLGFHPVYSDWYWFSYGLQDRAVNPLTNQRHNDHMIALCWSAAAMGRNVVLDTTSRWKNSRDQIQNYGLKYGIRVVFVRCQCSEAVSRARIRQRKHIGPNDFGTDFEYRRIKNDFQEINGDELNERNMIEVDSELLHCSVANVLSAGDKTTMSEIVDAIRLHYFVQIDPTNRDRG